MSKKKKYTMIGAITLCCLLAICLIIRVCTKKTMVFENGMAMPFLEYSDLRNPAYTNEGSDISRFCVYVETDNDTDNDGMADLVKVFVEVPTAAIKGDYKAAVIYDPTPYGVGTNETPMSELVDSEIYSDASFDYNILYKDCEKRVPSGIIRSAKLAASADPLDWNYTTQSSGVGYGYTEMYNYFLLRGFAIVQCSGIGTYGSEGFELCGTDLERDAHKCVVEWLTGNRKAYSSPTDNIEVKADWSNKHVAMTGCSYGGTLPFEVATTGVEGLETIIPIAGIASWYDYTNSQGVPVYFDPDYTETLAFYNSGASFVDDNWTVLDDDYAAYLMQVREDEAEANGDYTDIWARSDYSKDYENIKCSALIIHGLNDFNVRLKQSDLMYQAFKEAGTNVKMILHQDGHNFIAGRLINGELGDEIMNKWLCHYLYGVENGIENMAELTVQSNLTGEFHTYDSWRDFNYSKVETNKQNKQTDVITTVNLAEFASSSERMDGTGFDDYLDLPKGCSKVYKLKIEPGSTIKGVPVINVNLSTECVGREGLMITAVLIDTRDDGKPFKAYNTNPSLYDLVTTRTIDAYKIGDGIQNNPVTELVQSNTYQKIVSCGWTDLTNPDKGYYADEYNDPVYLEKGKEYSYHIYLNPTVYTVDVEIPFD